MGRSVAFLRGVNVGGHRRLPMAELRAAMVDAGFRDVASYVASGNLLFATERHAAGAEARLAALIAARFAIDCAVIVRDAAVLAMLVTSNPFPDAARDRPKLLHVLLSQAPLPADVAATLAIKTAPGEAVAAAGGALWIDYAEGAARSKLTPAAIDRAVGSPVTARNWTTLTTLVALAGA